MSYSHFKICTFYQFSAKNVETGTKCIIWKDYNSVILKAIIMKKSESLNKCRTVGKVLRELTHEGHLTNFQEFPGLEIFTIWQLHNLCAHLHFFSWIFEDNHLFSSNFLLPTYIFSAPSKIGLSKWRYYGNFCIIVTIEKRPTAMAVAISTD